MIKVLIFSDAHSRLDTLDYVIKQYNPDRIFGLGDYEVNEIELNNRNVIGVRGNSYFDPDFSVDHTFTLCGFNFLLTHGHTHSVRNSLLNLSYFAKERSIDIAFYGHTHIAKIDQMDKIYFINPGSITIPYSPDYSTVALMELKEKYAKIKIVDSITFKTYKEIEIKK